MVIEPEPKPAEKTGVQRNDDQVDPCHLKGIEDHETWEELDEEPLVEGEQDKDQPTPFPSILWQEGDE